MSRRIDGARGKAFEIWFDGAALSAYPGETVAAVLLAAGHRRTRISGRRGAPRGVYCAMGLCWECLVVVDGRPNLRACLTPVAPGMRVETQRGQGHPAGEPR